MPATSLRILVILPMYGGSLPIGRYCASALRGLGHTVRLFEAPLLYPAFTGLKGLGLTPAQTVPLENSFLQVVSQAIWAQVQSLEPHFVLALAQAPMSRSLLQRLRRAGVRTAMWFVEDYRIFNYWRTYAPLYDAFAVIQKAPFLSELARIGQAHALYPNRRLAFRPLAGRDFKIWGSDWEGESLLAGNIQRRGARISEEESVKVYNAARVNLNLHSSLQGGDLVGHGDFVNPRTFELAAMGAFQLVDQRSLLGELFAPDELATFTSMNEFYAGIDHFLAHPEEREAYARRARERTLREHTYERRMDALLDYLEAELGPWPQSGPEQAAPPELGPQLREELAQLMRKLGLGPHAAFDDVLARLREQSGALSDLETSLLFLDEWRGQYLKK